MVKNVLPSATVVACAFYTGFRVSAGRRLTARFESPRHRNNATTQRQSLSQIGRTKACDLPVYELPDDYTDPLNGARREKESAVMATLTEDLYAHYLDRLVNPTSGLKVLSRNWEDVINTRAVVKFLEAEFKDMGLTTCVQTFTSWRNRFNPDAAGQPVSNVIAYFRGSVYGTTTMGAHYDTLPGGQKASPGAVDNGSGVAALLASARAVMAAKNSSGFKPKKSLYFVAFGGKEENLYGSNRFAMEVASQGSSLSPIPAACRALEPASWPAGHPDHDALILDMIGWKDPELPHDTVTMEARTWAADLFPHVAQSNIVNNGDRLTLKYNLMPYGSDQESFTKYGIESALIIDNDGDAESYPCYHKSCDTIDKVNVTLATEITKMTLGALLRQSGIS